MDRVRELGLGLTCDFYLSKVNSESRLFRCRNDFLLHTFLVWHSKETLQRLDGLKHALAQGLRHAAELHCFHAHA